MVFKCKMCGASLDVAGKEALVKCKYCGSVQTVPKLNEDVRANLYDRANYFLRNNEYDIALLIYQQILNDDATDAEAYFSIALCRYGVQYVKDPSTKIMTPTINRIQYASFLKDQDYLLCLQYADEERRKYYYQEGLKIEGILQGVLNISKNESPYDVFICYKETDELGRRTQDSVIAQDIYNALTKNGLKVFFSRVTLEDKIGVAYEPYIFSALNSAKLMLVVGASKDHFNAVWVKNEWSRFLALIKQGANKNIVPVFYNMTAYDMPTEFAHLQAVDASKLGYLQDLTRGVEKLLGKTNNQTKNTAVTTNINLENVLKLARNYLEVGEYDNADRSAETALSINVNCAEAYIIKLMAKRKVKNENELSKSTQVISTEWLYKKARSVADSEYLLTLNNIVNERIYCFAKSRITKDATIEDLQTSLNELTHLYKNFNYKKSKEYVDKIQTLIDNKINKQKSTKKVVAIIVASLCIISIVLSLIYVIIPKIKYDKALNYMYEGEYSQATELLEDNIWGDAEKQRLICVYILAGDYARATQEGATRIVIPKNKTVIQANAFYNCDNLEEVIIHSNVTEIQHSAFLNCTNLKLVVIEKESKLTYIRSNAFENCVSLESFTIVKSVKRIETSAFKNSGITSVIFEEADGWKKTTAYGAVIGNANKVVLEKPSEAASFLLNANSFTLVKN